ncbi:MAG: hypothetical protein Kow0091_11760 [Geminocystis sp.]
MSRYSQNQDDRNPKEFTINFFLILASNLGDSKVSLQPVELSLVKEQINPMMNL